MSVTFTRGSAVTTVTPVAGTLQYGDEGDVRGGRVTEVVKAGLAKNGQLQVVISDTNDSDIKDLVSPAGAGDYDVAGSDIASGSYSYDALVDVNYGEGEDGVEVATVSWKGTTEAA